MRGSGIKPSGGIGSVDATSDLQAPGPSGEGFAGGGIIAGAEFDNVSAAQIIRAKRLCIPTRRPVRHEIFGRRTANVAQAASYDLFHPSLVKVNAWPEFCHRFNRASSK